MDEPNDDILDMILDHEINVVNAVADVALIADLQAVQNPNVPQRRVPRNPIW
jgi:hypothetical protein